jgi:hypothetical protein
MVRDKKRERAASDIVSPPHKMSKSANESHQELMARIDQMFDAIDAILDDLIDVKRDTKTGRCNERGLSPKFLIKQLRKIETNKNGIAPIFASWEFENYYKF